MAKGNRPTTATEAKRRLAKFGYDGPARWASIDDFVQDKTSAKAVIMAHEGTTVLGDPIPEHTNPHNQEAVQTLADLTYLGMTTGVDGNAMNAAYEALGVDTSDPFAFVEAQQILEGEGFKPGDIQNFYGGNSAVDVGAATMNNIQKEAVANGFVQSTPENLKQYVGEINPDTGKEYQFIENNNQANQVVLQNALATNNIATDQTAAVITTDTSTYQQSAAQADTKQQTNQAFQEANLGSNNLLDLFQIFNQPQNNSNDPNLIKPYTPATTYSGPTTGYTQPTYTGGTGPTVTGTNVPAYTPTTTPFKPVVPYTPVTGGIGTQEVGVPTYENQFVNQAADFKQRGIAQQSYLQPQTLAEQQQAGRGDFSGQIEQRPYQNRQGMIQYISFINGMPQTSIPSGYFPLRRVGYGGGSPDFGNGKDPTQPMARGGYIKGYEEGGDVKDNMGNIIIPAAVKYSKVRSNLQTPEQFYTVMSDGSELGPSNSVPEAKALGEAQAKVNMENYNSALQTRDATRVNVNQPINQAPGVVYGDEVGQAQADMSAQAFVNPAGSIAAAPTTNIDPNAAGTVMASDTGQALPVAPIVDANQIAQVQDTTQAQMPTSDSTFVAPSAVKAQEDMTALLTGDGDEDIGVQAAQSDGPTQTITGQTQDTTAISELDAAQIDKAQTVQDAPTRTLQEGESITKGNQGLSSVDQTKVDDAFGTGEIKAASVQDELTGLMAQFEDGNTPAWAAGSMRKAMATMSARGLGASSMAGQAIIQAAMEAALPIAQIDAGNKQQMALFKGEQRAKFLQIDFDQDFQAKVINAAKVSEVANMQFNADQQIALENARMAQTVDLANLTNRQALVMAEAAQLSQLELTSLNNLQQAQVQNAQNFLQIDMANLSNVQQTEMFKAQTLANTILSDTAAENAMAQFNASNEQQRDQFMMNMSAQISQSNAAATNAMKQFNANEANAMAKYNSEIQNQREMFNAQQFSVVAQANAKWRQDTATMNAAVANQSNFEYAKQVNALTNKALDQIWQRERDLMSFSMAESESALDRSLKLLLADKDLESVREQLDAQDQSAKAGLAFRFLFGMGNSWKGVF